MSAYFGQPPQTDEDYWIVRSPGIIAGSVVAIVVMVTLTVARLILRWRRKSGQKFGADDWMIIPALILAVLYPAIQIYLASNCGLGKHLYDLTYHQNHQFNKVASCGKIIFYFAVATIKLSITLFNMRLTGLSSPRWMRVHWTFFAIIVCYMVSVFFAIVFQCNPPRVKFDIAYAGKLPKKAKCYSDSLQATALSIPHVLTDVCLLAVPIIVLWKTQIDWKTKLRLYFVFCIGGLSFVANIMRLVALSNIHTDTLWNQSSVIKWAFIDLAFGISAASLPVLSTLLPRSLRNSTKHGSRATPKKSYGQITGPLSSSDTRPHAKDSQEGIVRQDEIELEYSARTGHRNDKFDLEKKPQANVHTMSEINGKGTSWADPYTMNNTEKR